MQRLRFSEVRTRGIHICFAGVETRIHRLFACLSQPDEPNVYVKGAMDGEGHPVSLIGRRYANTPGVAASVSFLLALLSPSFSFSSSSSF